MVFDAGRQQLSPDRTPDTSSASLRRGCRDQDRVTSETRPRFDAQITRGGVNSRRGGKKKKKTRYGATRNRIGLVPFRLVSSRPSPMDIERAWPKCREEGLGEKEKEKKEKFQEARRSVLSLLFFSLPFLRIDHHRALLDSSSSSRAVRARESSTTTEKGGRRGQKVVRCICKKVSAWN